MNTPIDLGTAQGVLPMTPARQLALQRDLERASDEVTLALRRGGSPQQYRDLCLLKTGVEVALQVLASSTASPG